MANALNVASLSLNAQEAQNFGEFIISRTIESPALTSVATIYNGIKMNTQVAIGGQMGLSGLKSVACGRMESGAVSILSEVFLNPVDISDTFSICANSIDLEFKPYFNKVNTYKEKYDIAGSDLQLYMTARVEESISQTINRAIWAGDAGIATATTGATGLAVGIDTDFYKYFDGIFAQIVDGVANTGNTIARVAISANTGTTAGAQELAAGASVTIFDAVIKGAGTALRQSADKQLLVSRDVFDNYITYLIGKGIDPSYTIEGIAIVKYKGIPVVNMEGAWVAFENVLQNTVTGLPYMPHKVILTVGTNIAIGTLQESGLKELDTYYDWMTKSSKIAFGFTLDAKLVENSMVSVAY